MGSTEVDLELVLHKSGVRMEEKATVAVVNAKMESSENKFDGKLSVVPLSTHPLSSSPQPSPSSPIKSNSRFSPCDASVEKLNG